jgi:predicted metal-dependent HD superfamily phosphohydrolase
MQNPEIGFFERSWSRAWKSLRAEGDGITTMQALIERYCEPHRAYHTVQHLRECLERFDEVCALAVHPATVELALWYHDAIYDVHSKTNEADSAALARETLAAAKASIADVESIVRLIMETRHAASPTDADAQLLVDIDLSILGAPRERFDEYETQIREEYKHVSDDLFFAKRKEILKSFLSRERIYSTEHFRHKLEATARDNLRRAIEGN